MLSTAPPRALLELARSCARAENTDEVLLSALPLVTDRLGARSALVVRPTVDGPVVVARSGALLDDDGLAAFGAGNSVGVQDAPPVPASWQRAGVGRLLVSPLPNGAGTLVIAFASASAEPSDVITALDLVLSALARVDAEQRLADLKARVDSAQQLANMGDYDWHIATDTNTWSDQLYRIYGYEPQSFNATYERFLAHIHPGDRDRVTGIHQAAYASGEPYQMIERIVRPDGEVRYLSSNGQVIRDDQDTPIRLRGTCIDVTERVLAEQAQQRSAARFRSLVETSPDAILVVDRAGLIVQANAHATELVGGSPVGHALAEIRPPAFGAYGLAGTEQGVPGVGLDGRALTLDLFTAPLSDVDDQDLCAVFLRDATDRLASETLAARLHEAQLRRRQALEINDNVVQGLTAALYSMQLGDARASASYLERTLDSARRLMNDWLNPLDGQPVQPGDLVRERPSVVEPEQLSGGARPQSVRPSASRPRVLVVDDNVGMRSLVRAQLEMSGGYDVVGEAVDGYEAVEQARSLRPEVVVLDLAMPRMDGLQALPQILAAVPGVSVIVLSGFDQATMAAKALTAGAVRYLEKGPAMDVAAVIDGILRAA